MTKMVCDALAMLRRLSKHHAHTAIGTAEEELNEEDQQLKGELDMMVERLTVRIDPNSRAGDAQTDSR